MEPPRAAKTITVYVNGDPHHSGKELVLSKDYGYLTELSGTSCERNSL